MQSLSVDWMNLHSTEVTFYAIQPLQCQNQHKSTYAKNSGSTIKFQESSRLTKFQEFSRFSRSVGTLF